MQTHTEQVQHHNKPFQPFQVEGIRQLERCKSLCVCGKAHGIQVVLGVGDLGALQQMQHRSLRMLQLEGVWNIRAAGTAGTAGTALHARSRACSDQP